MKDRSNNQSEGQNSSRSTNNLEQLPSSKKKTLRTAALDNSQTQSLDESKTNEHPNSAPTESFTEPLPDRARSQGNQAAAPPQQNRSENRPVEQPKPAPSAPPQRPEARQTVEMNAQTVNRPGQGGESTSRIDAMRTSNHEIVKAPVSDHEEKPPVKAAAEVKPPKESKSSAKPVNEPIINKTAETEAVNVPPVKAVTAAEINRPSQPGSAQEVRLFGSLNGFEDGTPEPPRTFGSKVMSAILWSIPFIILLAAAVGVVAYVPGMRERLPARFASMVGFKSNTTPQLSLQEYRVTLNDKDKTATISGVVTNLSSDSIGPVQIEFKLTKREDVRLSDTKLVPVEPAQLGPKQEGKYQFTISAKDYEESKFARALNGEAALRVKKFGIVDPTPQVDPTKLPPVQAVTKPSPSPKPDNEIYEGSVR